MDDDYKVTYTFNVQYDNVHLVGEPTHSSTTIIFDGTDAHIDTIVNQFVTFLKAAGYSFRDLEIIKDANPY